MEAAERQTYYRVVVNDEGCYSIWPTDLAVPQGWTSTGFSGVREAALKQVAELWRAAHRPTRPADNGDNGDNG